MPGQGSVVDMGFKYRDFLSWNKEQNLERKLFFPRVWKCYPG